MWAVVLQILPDWTCVLVGSKVSTQSGMLLKTWSANLPPPTQIHPARLTSWVDQIRGTSQLISNQ
jgi:hypothetical protein